MLYHAEVYMPERIQKILNVSRTLPITYSPHALEAAQSDRYGTINLPSAIDTASAQVIEVETCESGSIQKIVYRMPYDAKHDIVMPIMCVNGQLLAKTVWLNRNDDLHRTLDVDRYATRA